MEQEAAGPQEDRRWQPTGDSDEWVSTTRESIFVSVRRCVANAMYASLADTVHPHQLQASDAVFRELHVCTQAYARALFALGQKPESAMKLIVAAAREASEPESLHPVVVAAIEQWCREAAESAS